MKLCGACQGKGEVNYEVCDVCGGEGLDTMATFQVGKISRRKQSEFKREHEDLQEKKKHKIDKKNATRGGFI